MAVLLQLKPIEKNLLKSILKSEQLKSGLFFLNHRTRPEFYSYAEYNRSKFYKALAGLKKMKLVEMLYPSAYKLNLPYLKKINFMDLNKQQMLDIPKETQPIAPTPILINKDEKSVYLVDNLLAMPEISNNPLLVILKVWEKLDTTQKNMFVKKILSNQTLELKLQLINSISSAST